MKRVHIQNRRVAALLGSLAILALILIVSVPTVFAAWGLRNNLPSNNENYQAAGEEGAIDLHLKHLDVAQVIVNRFGAYYPSSVTSSDNKSITITKGESPSRVCNIDADVTAGNLRVRINVAGANATYNIPIEDVCDGNNFYGRTFNFPNGTLYPHPESNHNFADIEISLQNTVMKAASTGQDLNYQVNLSGGSASNGLIALKENLNPQQFGLRSTYTNNNPQPNNKQVRATLPFGYPCSADVGGAEERFVKVYDADAVFGETFMWVERDGVKLNHSDYENNNDSGGSSGGNYKVVNMNETQFDNNLKRWTLEGSNESFNKLTIRREAILKGHKYELVILNTGNGASLSTHYNTLSVAIPQHGIYSEMDLGNDPCNYSLRPTVSVNPDTFVYYPDFRVDATIQKTGAGPVPENHSWELYTVRYPSEPQPSRDLTNGKVGNGVNPCNVIPSGYSAGSCNRVNTLAYPGQPSYTIDPYASGGPHPVGTRLCFFARIQNPTYLEDDNDQWHYSDLDCSVSAKKPRVQFLGSDVRIGGIATSSYFALQGTNYGSWAEYGVFTAGANALVSSGNSLRNGNPAPPGSWNGLTFANTPSYGNYNPVPSASSAYTYFRSLPLSGTLNQTNPTTGVYDMGNANIGGDMTVNTNGQSVIIRKTGTLRINNDIIVNNTGVTGASNLSQVVIIADNIELGVNSNRIDAWLITSPTGSINTCAIGATQLTSDNCPTTTTINGPIYTNRLMLRRTAGNNPPNQFNEPAERFNLRPDAQLWAYNYANKADYAQTDFVQELPPRY